MTGLPSHLSFLPTLAASGWWNALLQTFSGLSRGRLTWQWHVPMSPAIPPWLLLLGFLAALGFILYLYHAQRQAVRWHIAAILAALRAALLFLLLLLVLRPSWQWTNTTTSAGTLWLVLDQSESMISADPQSSPTERLRRADALGYLPANARGNHLDLHLARLTALRDSLLHLKPATSDEAARQESPAAVQQFLDTLQAWNRQVDSVASAVGSDPAARSAGNEIVQGIERISTTLREGIAEAQRQRSLAQAAAAIPWSTVQTNLDLSASALARLANSADEAFISVHSVDPEIQDALARAGRLTRAECAFLALTARSSRGSDFAQLLPQYRTKIATFADTVQAIPNVDRLTLDDTLKSTLAPAGKATNIAAALRLVAEQVQPDEAAAVVILSDGRQNVPGDPAEIARLLAARGVTVNTLLAGSREVSPDAAIDQIDLPDWIFKDDTVRGTALVRLDGLAGRSARVEFFRDGAPLTDQTKVVRPQNAQDTQRLAFTDKPPPSSSSDASAHEYEVRVQEMTGEANLQNNKATARVAVKKDRLAALLIEDRPRWDYQYLRNYLGRDQRLKLQTVLLSPARVERVATTQPVKASPANPRMEAEIPPGTAEEWKAFDLIVLGDVGPDILDIAQQQFIAAAVRDRGATLLVMAGPRNMPARYENMPLADLLPVQLASPWNDEALARHLRLGFRPAATPEASATGSVLAQLGIDTEANSRLWGAMPSWYWHSDRTAAKSSASVIWSIEEPIGSAAAGDDSATGMAAARRRALLSMQSVGLGRVLFLAGDQTWRMRQVAGENLQDRFWGQFIRWAVGSDLPAGGRFVRFGANRQRYTAGDPIIITVRMLREDLAPYTGQSLEAVARLLPEKNPNAPSATTTPKEVDHARLVENPAAPGYYTATLTGVPAGTIELSLRGGEVERLLAVDPTATLKTLQIQVLPQLDLERRNLNTDAAALQRIAQAGGGMALDAAYQDVLASMLPKVQQVHRSDERIGFYADATSDTTWVLHILFFLAFVGIITAEWMVRKSAGLV